MKPSGLQAILLGTALLAGLGGLAACDNVQDLTSVSGIPAHGWSEVYPIFAKSCLPCHGAGNGPDLANKVQSEEMAKKIVDAVDQGWMPPPGTVSFGPAQKKIIDAWADSIVNIAKVPQKKGG
jgi:Cytochrome C oxidase, cbb3-type, subunit III